MLEKLKKEYFGSSLDKLKEELDNMLDANSLAQRRKQIDLCANLDQYHNGAEVMLKLRDMYKLKGDFSDLEKVVQSVSLTLSMFISVFNCMYCGFTYSYLYKILLL